MWHPCVVFNELRISDSKSTCTHWLNSFFYWMKCTWLLTAIYSTVLKGVLKLTSVSTCWDDGDIYWFYWCDHWFLQLEVPESSTPNHFFSSRNNIHIYSLTLINIKTISLSFLSLALQLYNYGWPVICGGSSDCFVCVVVAASLARRRPRTAYCSYALPPVAPLVVCVNHHINATYYG